MLVKSKLKSTIREYRLSILKIYIVSSWKIRNGTAMIKKITSVASFIKTKVFLDCLQSKENEEAWLKNNLIHTWDSKVFPKWKGVPFKIENRGK